MMDKLITLCLYEIERENNQELFVLKKETEVFAEEESLSKAFHFRSTAEGHRLVTTYFIHPFEYNNEQRIKAHGKELKIEFVRPVVKDNLNLLELTVGELDGR